MPHQPETSSRETGTGRALAWTSVILNKFGPGQLRSLLADIAPQRTPVLVGLTADQLREQIIALLKKGMPKQ